MGGAMARIACACVVALACVSAAVVDDTIGPVELIDEVEVGPTSTTRTEAELKVAQDKATRRKTRLAKTETKVTSLSSKVTTEEQRATSAETKADELTGQVKLRHKSRWQQTWQNKPRNWWKL